MAVGGEITDTGRVASALTIRRVRGDLEVLATAGLDTATFVEEFLESLSRAVPHVAACVATHSSPAMTTASLPLPLALSTFTA